MPKPERMQRVWSPEEQAQLGELVAAGVSAVDIAAELGRSLHSVRMKRKRLYPQVAPPVPVWGGSPLGNQRWWTRERVVAALTDYAAKNRGSLPTSDHVYNAVKKGRTEWPPARRVLEYFGTMADAWAAVPGTKGRYHRSWVAWTTEDDDYLLSHAGDQTLKIVAKSLGRTWAACKRRLYDLQAGRARDVCGYMSASQVAKEYRCPLSRVVTLIGRGELKAHRVQGGHYWRIDPADAEAIAGKLRAPKKRSYKNSPPDVGDYDARYGLRRIRTKDGKVLRVAS